MSMKGEERRKHIRIFLPGGQVRLASGILLVLVGKVVDVSLGGAKFKCNAGFRIDDEIDMEMTLPTGMKLKCVVKVAHLEPSESNENQVLYGVQFVNLSAEEQAELGEYVMKKRAEQDDLLHGELN